MNRRAWLTLIAAFMTAGLHRTRHRPASIRTATGRWCQGGYWPPSVDVQPVTYGGRSDHVRTIHAHIDIDYGDRVEEFYKDLLPVMKKALDG